jgi:hypothetical protein
MIRFVRSHKFSVCIDVQKELCLISVRGEKKNRETAKILKNKIISNLWDFYQKNINRASCLLARS